MNNKLKFSKIWSNVIDLYKRAQDVLQALSFFFPTSNMFKKFVLMSVYHFIPGPTLRRLVPPLLPPLSGGSYLACGNKAKANNFFSFYSASSNRKIKFSIYCFFFFLF